jgi:hypothetical protein
VLRHLDEALGYELDTDLDSDEPFRWQRHGFAKVWFAGGLAFVKVPEVGNAVLVTIIETSALIGPNRVLWEALGKGPSRHVLAEPGGKRAFTLATGAL